MGIDLKEDHVRQAANYGSNSGVEWIVLTNGIHWKIYKIIFSKPIEKEFVYEFNFLEINPKRQDDLEMLYYLSKNSISKPKSKASLDDYHIQKQTLNRFILGQILLTETVSDSVKRVLKKMSPDMKVSNEEITFIINNEIIKRDVLEGEKAIEAKKRLQKLQRTLKKTEKDKSSKNKESAEENLE